MSTHCFQKEQRGVFKELGQRQHTAVNKHSVAGKNTTKKNNCIRFEKSVDLTKINMHSLIHFTCSFQQRK